MWKSIHIFSNIFNCVIVSIDFSQFTVILYFVVFILNVQHICKHFVWLLFISTFSDQFFYWICGFPLTIQMLTSMVIQSWIDKFLLFQFITNISERLNLKEKKKIIKEMMRKKMDKFYNTKRVTQFDLQSYFSMKFFLFRFLVSRIFHRFCCQRFLWCLSQWKFTHT